MSRTNYAGTYFDTHAHLDYDYDGSVEGYIERAVTAGVSRILTVGSNTQNWQKIQSWSESITDIDIYFSVGIHPHDAINYDDNLENQMVPYLAHPRCIALGEIGLDYHYDNSPREVQIQICKRQLELARKHNKPIIIHSRQGEDDLLELLKEHCSTRQTKSSPGVIHCFSGSPRFASDCLNLGFFISFSGIVTFKKAEEVREAAKLVPMDRLLIETDAPYLAPIPHRGKTNESSLIIHTAQYLADLKKLSLPDLANATSSNAVQLFKIA